MRQLHSTPTRTKTAAQARPLFALGAAATLTLAWLGGCSSSSDNNNDPCKSVYSGKCGTKCSGDADCAAGLYCSTDGTCTADCAKSVSSCKSGFVCDASGHCVQGAGAVGGGIFGGADTDASCRVDTRQGEGIPADIFIMNDQSLSMTCAIPTGGDRWAAMKKALSQFVQSQEASGMGVGIQYFGQKANSFDTQGSCNVADYSAADVEIAPLPGNAQNIIQSLNNHQPWSYTPTPAALQGAIDHATQWAKIHPERYVAVVLATDGEPNLCGNPGDRIGSVAQIAAAGFSGANGNPKVPTYVVGIVGGSAASGGRGCNLDPAPPNKADLDRVAQGGGTNHAFIVDAASGDTAAQFLDALNSIRGAATIPCQYTIPPSEPGKQLDPTLVNITVTPSGGTAQDLARAMTQGDCDGQAGGWYYDNNDTPTKILLCPATCNIVDADAQARVDIRLGCFSNVTTR